MGNGGVGLIGRIGLVALLVGLLVATGSGLVAAQANPEDAEEDCDTLRETANDDSAEFDDEDAEAKWSRCQITDRFEQISNFIVFLIAAVAVPNGGFGLFQWMTAGADQQKDQQGRQRIRNTFIALAGAAVIKLAVNVITLALGLPS